MLLDTGSARHLCIISICDVSILKLGPPLMDLVATAAHATIPPSLPITTTREAISVYGRHPDGVSRSAAHDMIKQRPSLPQSKMPAVENSVADSLEVWAEDLRSLFDSARERFADIRWHSTGDTLSDAIWAHKGMIFSYAA